ncbi:hypothetical protein L9F63_009427, partial [Diploptera punctata]
CKNAERRSCPVVGPGSVFQRTCWKIPMNSRYGEKIYIQKNKEKIMNFEIPGERSLITKFFGTQIQGRQLEKKKCTSCERSLNYATKMARMLQSSTCEEQRSVVRFLRPQGPANDGKLGPLNAGILKLVKDVDDCS